MPRVRIGSRSFSLPENRPARLAIGVLLIVGGCLGFLPVLGFWMIPLGFLVLATDFPSVRRFNRRTAVGAKRWWNGTRRQRSEST